MFSALIHPLLRPYTESRAGCEKNCSNTDGEVVGFVFAEILTSVYLSSIRISPVFSMSAIMSALD
jgi:hypothetical protein